LQLENIHDSSPYMLERLSSSYQFMAKFLSLLKRDNEAFHKALQSVKTLDRMLLQDPENSRWVNQKYNAYFKLFTYTNSETEALVETDLASLAANIKVDAAKDMVLNLDLVWANYHLAAATYSGKKRNFAESLNQAIQAKELFLKLQKNRSTDVFSELANSMLLESKALRLMGNTAEANLVCQQTKSLLEPVLLTNKDFVYLIPFAESLSCLNEENLNSELTSLLNKANMTHKFLNIN
ncbi:MAG: hypothetical protein MHMPM18_005073, partial [Marteilia pararefringens]